MMFDKTRFLRLTFASFFFAVLYSIGISIVTEFEFDSFVWNTFVLTLIFVVVTNAVDIILRFFKNKKRK